MQETWKLRRTTLITVGLLAMLAGLVLARVGWQISVLWLPVAALLVATGRRRRLVLIIGVTMFGVTLGAARGRAFNARLMPYAKLAGQPVVLEVTADDEAVYSRQSQLSFDGSNVRILEPISANLPGRLKVEGYGAPAIYRGDVVRVEGRFYRTRGSRQGSVGYSALTVVGRRNFWLDKIRLRFIAGMQSSLPEPLASFGLGLLIGQRSNLPKGVGQQLAAVGLTHIIAVSGYNLTILVRAVQRFGRKRSKYQRLMLALLLIGGFVLVTGFSASIVRAAIVSLLSLAAWYYGRNFRPLLLLALAAVLTAFWNPLYLWTDTGWHLSFLAFFGVIVVAPLLAQRLGRRLSPLTLLLLESTSAQLLTAPLILYVFGTASTLAIVANLLIVPLVPLAMLLAFVAGLAGMIHWLVASWLAWPAQLVLRYMLDVVALLAAWPQALVRRTLAAWQMVAFYAVIAFSTVIVWRKTARLAEQQRVKINTVKRTNGGSDLDGKPHSRSKGKTAHANFPA